MAYKFVKDPKIPAAAGVTRIPLYLFTVNHGTDAAQEVYAAHSKPVILDRFKEVRKRYETGIKAGRTVIGSLRTLYIDKTEKQNVSEKMDD